jgi:uncharacterized membrane protein
MANVDLIMPAQPVRALPAVRHIQLADLKDALSRGLDDFWAMPTHVIFLCMIYPVIGVALGNATFNHNAIPLLYPLAAGFALIGPIAGIWLFELSRRRELGLDTSWRHGFDVVHSPSFPSILALGLLLLAIFGLWIAAAQAIYISAFGYREIGAEDFARQVLTTPEGRRMMLVGNLVGLPFAIVAATISVVSFPLLLDRNVGFSVALMTSVRAVVKNPVVMAAWGLIVAALLAIGSLPFFLGLAIVMPILGHATWHLYRKVVVPEAGERPEYHPRDKGTRYAADFPASLFFPAKREKLE